MALRTFGSRFGSRLTRDASKRFFGVARRTSQVPASQASTSFDLQARMFSGKPAMFCFQCEQTEGQKGCTTVGVCGKTPDVAALQDLLCWQVKGIAMYANRARKLGKKDPEIDRFVLTSLFSTVTNVNFDASRFVTLCKQATAMRDKAKAMYEKAGGKEKLTGPADFKIGADQAAMIADGGKVGIFERKAQHGDDIIGLTEMTLYGLKGAAAYAEHAHVLGRESEEVYAGFHHILDALCNQKPTVPELLGLALKVGELNLKVLERLDAGETENYGHPEPTVVSRNPVPGKCILISGHDLKDVEEVLKQTQGKGINVYTHGELLPAHSYPKLKKYKHLVGHFGGPWQLQKFEFSEFPGPIVMTTNCIVEPRKSYKGRIFTRSVVGFPGVQHIVNYDFSAVIKAAEKEAGFTAADCDGPKKTYTVGFGRNAVMNVAPVVIDAVKTGKISRFFVVGGCDGSEGERSYFRDVVTNAPKDSIILTLGCGKYRFNDLDLGNIGGIPRILDMGQCNDSYSAIQVAVALAGAFKTDVNSLPLSFAISWFEQKAVAVLCTLLHLNIQNIRLGPHLPGFATPAMLDALVTNFKIHPIGNAKEDMKAFVKGQ